LATTQGQIEALRGRINDLLIQHNGRHHPVPEKS
jgi:hypothetical protein